MRCELSLPCLGLEQQAKRPDRFDLQKAKPHCGRSTMLLIVGGGGEARFPPWTIHWAAPASPQQPSQHAEGGTSSPEPPVANTSLQGPERATTMSWHLHPRYVLHIFCTLHVSCTLHIPIPCGSACPLSTRTAAVPDQGTCCARRSTNPKYVPVSQGPAACSSPASSKTGDEHSQVPASPGTGSWQESCHRISCSRPSRGGTVVEPPASSGCPFPARPKPPRLMGSLAV